VTNTRASLVGTQKRQYSTCSINGGDGGLGLDVGLW
jgi:hypothetical protein